MKLLFVHDHRFYEDEEYIIHTGGSFPASIWNNYLMYFNQITIFARRSYNPDYKNGVSSLSENINFLLTNNYRSPYSLLNNFSKLKRELSSAIADSDVVLARLPSILGFIAVIETKKQNKPLWIEQVGNAKDAILNHGTLLGKISGYPLDIINKKLVEKADFVSYVTNYHLQKAYPCSAESITVGLSDVVIKKVLSLEDINLNRFFDKTLKLCLIGNLEVLYKGQHILLKAISKLPKHVSKNIELNFIGGGDASRIINFSKNLGLSKNIKFMGPLKSGEEVNDFLSQMSLYVQCSLQEGLPRATIEAMSMGCPVIGSKAGGIPELVNPIFLHDKGDSSKLSKDILYLFKNRNALYDEALRSLKISNNYHSGLLIQKRKEFYNDMDKFLKTKYFF